MAEDYGPEEVNRRYVAAMGKGLGQFFALLWNECAWLHWKWSDYVILFGSKTGRVDLLNRAAPAFFKLVQNAMWEDVLLHVCRLTDSPKSCGKETLTLRRLPDLVSPTIRRDVKSFLQEAVFKAAFARDWRNRHIAHRDLGLAMDKRANPLAQASRRRVKDVLDAIVSLLNYIEHQQCGSTTMYEYASPHGNRDAGKGAGRNASLSSSRANRSSGNSGCSRRIPAFANSRANILISNARSRRCSPDRARCACSSTSCAAALVSVMATAEC